jgi:arylsulfatase A-like enzyme
MEMTAVVNPGEHERIPLCENYTVIQLVSELQKYPHEQADQEFIAEYWAGFKREARAERPLSLHFQQHRG